MPLSLIYNIKQKIHDMKTISKLCQGAETHAILHGKEKPGAEHFMLSAFDLPDNTARNIFNRLNIDPSEINEVIKMQNIDALNCIGINQSAVDSKLEPSETVRSNLKLYNAQPSGQLLMQKLYQRNKKRKTALIGAHVLEIIASMEHSIISQALGAMGIDSTDLQKAIEAESHQNTKG